MEIVSSFIRSSVIIIYYYCFKFKTKDKLLHSNDDSEQSSIEIILLLNQVKWKKNLCNHNSFLCYFIISRIFIKYFIKNAFNLHLRKLQGKLKNYIFKIPTKTNSLSKELVTSKLLLDSFYSKNIYRYKKKKKTF